MDACSADNCKCVHAGDCYAVDYASLAFSDGSADYDYFIALTATNNAKLVTNKTMKVGYFTFWDIDDKKITKKRC